MALGSVSEGARSQAQAQNLAFQRSRAVRNRDAPQSLFGVSLQPMIIADELLVVRGQFL